MFVEAALDAVYEDPESDLDGLGQRAKVAVLEEQVVPTDDVRAAHPRPKTKKVVAMTETVYVTSAPKSAAQAIVRRTAKTGRPISDSVRKVANAQVERADDPSRKAS